MTIPPTERGDKSPWQIQRVFSVQYRTWVKRSMHCEELSSLDVSGFDLPLWPGCYVSWVSDDWPAYMLMTRTLFLPFIWLFRTCRLLCRYLVMADFPAASSWLLIACGIPSSLYLSWTSAMLCSGTVVQSPQVWSPGLSWMPCTTLTQLNWHSGVLFVCPG